MEYLLVSTAVAGTVLFVAFFLRSAREARELCQGSGGAEPETGEFWSDRARSAAAAVSGIFSSEDERFVSNEAGKQVSGLFRRERKKLALRWIERQKREAAAVMSRHREEARLATDLQPANELKLFFRYVRLRLTFGFLAVSVWLVGPQRLRGLAEKANAVFHGMRNVKTLRGDN